MNWHQSLILVSILLDTPHVNTQDEVINGYFIPQGTVIYANIG
jgi:hypothetical protein